MLNVAFGFGSGSSEAVPWLLPPIVVCPLPKGTPAGHVGTLHTYYLSLIAYSQLYFLDHEYNLLGTPVLGQTHNHIVPS